MAKTNRVIGNMEEAISEILAIDLKVNRKVRTEIRKLNSPEEMFEVLRETALHVVSKHGCLSGALAMLHIATALEGIMDQRKET